jgi:cyclophilin family peptidyl-prolyl cis-trans isomerase
MYRKRHYDHIVADTASHFRHVAPLVSVIPMIIRPLRFGLLVSALAGVSAQASFAQTKSRGAAPAIAAPQTPAQRRALLLDPKRAFWTTHAPATFTADIETSRGTVTIELIRAWAPVGVDHFYNLARAGYFDDSRFFRVLFGFIAQFGIAGDPAIANLWGRRPIPADSVREKNVRGTLAYAQFKPSDRTTNVFFNIHDNPNLDTLKFAPIGRVVQGMDIVDSLYANYGELPTSDPPLGNPKRLYAESNKYLDEKYPKLDRIVKITVRTDAPPTSPQ